MGVTAGALLPTPDGNARIAAVRGEALPSHRRRSPKGLFYDHLEE